MPHLRGGLIGCGFFAPNHLWAWRDVEGAEISAVCDQDPARAAEYARRWEIRAHYSDPAAMLAAEQLDFVDIVTPAPTHRRLAEQALEHSNSTGSTVRVRGAETSADDNLKTLAAVEAAYLSAERGLAVRPAELLSG